MLGRRGPRRAADGGGATGGVDGFKADAVGWHELRPPGSFALCANAEFDGYVARELTKVVEAATYAVRRFPHLGLILTGSLARGEGVLVRERDGRARWLSDIDCLVAVPNRESLCGALFEALTHATAAVQAEATSHATGLNIRLSPILSAHLSRMRPTIFSRELAAHGKLLSGRPLAIPMVPPGPGDLRTRRADAFRLLNNRIMEQVALRESTEAGTAAAQRGYGLAKFWTELATSLSAFLNCYRTTYRERQLALEAALADPRNPLDREIAGDLRRGLEAAMRVRRGELDPSEWPEDAGFDQAAWLAQRVWCWESARMSAGTVSRISSDWRAIPCRLRRAATLSQCARDWARWCLRPDVSRRMGLRVILPSLRSGSPGNAIHAAGCLLEFFWDDIGEHRGQGRKIARMLSAMFGLRGGPRDLPTRRQLVGRAVTAWRSHLSGAAL
jgi:hypothetical protein